MKLDNTYKINGQTIIAVFNPAIIIILMLVFVFNGRGQTTLWSETFESTNSLTLVQASQTNYWLRGTSTAYAGSYSMYTTNGSGNTYTITASSISHAYKDILIPAGATNVSLSFYWKCYGESTYDFLRVYVDPSLTTPVAGSYPTAGTQVGQYNQNSAFTQATINLSAYAGSTIRLIFVWRNDGSVGTQPPAAIDNVLVTYTPAFALACGNTNLGTLSPSCGNWNTAVYTAGTIPYWAFTATAGYSYQFSLCPHSGGTEDSYIHIANSAGTDVATYDDNGLFSYCYNMEGSGTWTCPVSGTYYVTACHFSCAAFTYGGSLRYMSYGGPLNSKGVITPTLSWQSTAYNASEVAYWSFSATNGSIYDFSLCSNSEDSYLRIYDATWTQITTADDNGPHCTGVPASMSWTATGSGTYYVVANHYSCTGFTNAGNLQYKCQTPCAATLNISGPTLACSYTNISYTATPSGFAGTPTYQWYYSNADGSSVVAFGASSGTGSAPYYTTYSGGLSQTLNINTFGGAYDHMHVWCVATYSGCSATSSNIALVTESAISAPTAGTHTPSQTQIIWNWNAVSGATGYKWNTTNNYATAIDVGTNLSRTETGLVCNTAYNRYVWAYKACGASSATTLFSTTTACCTTPVISNMTASVCSGSAFTVTPVNGTNGTVPAGTTYSWAAPGVSGISGTAAGSNVANISGTLVNATGGTINVVYTVTPKSATCTGSTFTVTVSVLPLPSATITPNPVPPFCYGGSQTLTAATGCGTPSYEWFRNGASTGITSATYSATTPGLYSVKVNCGGCVRTSAPVTVVVRSNDFTLNVIQPVTTGLSIGDYVWSGNTSINWHIASNWLVYNGSGVFAVASAVPDSTKNVFIRAYTGCASNLCNILSGNTGKCRNITIESSLTMNSVCYLEVARNWTNTAGTFNAGNGTVVYNGRKNTTGTIYTGGDGAGKQFYNIEIKSESNSSLGSNDGNRVNLEGNIRINNNFVLTSGYQFNVNSGSLMSVGGNFTHNICEFNRGLGAVTLTGAGKVIDGSAATYFRILNITGSYTLNSSHMYLWSNPSGDYGDLNILAGGLLNASFNTIHIDGSWTNNGTFSAATSTVSFERGFDQFVKSGGSSFYNVTLDKTVTPPYVTMTDPAWITNYGSFILGIINYSGTGSLTFNDNAASNGGATNSFVDGSVIKKGNENFLFPVGDVVASGPWLPHVWAPLNINNATGTAADQFACEYFFTAAPNNYNAWNICNYGVDLHHVSGIEYWDLDRNAGSSVPWVTLYYKNAARSGIQTPSGLVVAHWENCPASGNDRWVSKGGIPVEDVAGVAGHVTNTIAFPNFSPVTFATVLSNNTLPVSLTAFSADCDNNEIHLQWSTASETNNAVFVVERSPDAVQWQIAGTVAGAGNSNSLNTYTFTDAKPLTADNYYRLSQTDFNGWRDTLGIVSASCGQMNASVSYFPNPFSSEVTVHMTNMTSDKAVLNIFDAIGQLVYSRRLNAAEILNQSVVVDLGSLAPGIYNVEFRSDVFISTDKIVRE